jgi:hypothetical protein
MQQIIELNSGVKKCEQQPFYDIIENLRELRASVADDETHHFALFFKRDRIEWWEKAGYGDESQIT